MSTLPISPVVVFLGGPNDGFIEVGEAATFYAFSFDVPASGGQSFKPTPSKVGRRVRAMPKYLWDAGQKLGMEKAGELLGRYGKLPGSGDVYELTEISDVFVYKYIGQYSDLYPDKGKTEPAAEG